MREEGKGKKKKKRGGKGSRYTIDLLYFFYPFLRGRWACSEMETGGEKKKKRREREERRSG